MTLANSGSAKARQTHKLAGIFRQHCRFITCNYSGYDPPNMVHLAVLKSLAGNETMRKGKFLWR
jgi:hypothetical protein